MNRYRIVLESKIGGVLEAYEFDASEDEISGVIADWIDGMLLRPGDMIRIEEVTE